MGINTPTARLSLAVLSTFFSVGFCSQMGALLYNSSYFRYTLSRVTYSTVAILVATFVGSLLPWLFGTGFRIGRRLTAFAGLLILTLGCVLATSAFSYAQSVAALVFYGLGIGLLSVTGVLWTVETVKAAQRGRKVVLLFVALLAGTAVAAWINYGFAYSTTPEARVRAPLGLQLVFLLFPVVFVWRADESWRWLLQHNQHDRARAVLSRQIATPQADPQFEQAFAALVRQSNQTATSSTLFSKKHTTPSSPQLRPWRRLLLGCFLQTMRELNGLPTVSFYLSSASQAVSGYSTGYAFVSAIPTISFLFSLIPYALIDRSATGCFSPVGRRGLLLLSALGMAAMFLIATIVSAGFGELSVDAWSYTSTSLQAAYLALFLCALLFHNLGFRPVTDLYTAEIAASNARTETQSIAVAWGVAVGVGIAFGAAYGITGLGTYFFLVWLVLNLVWVVLIFLLYPETQGRNLEEVDGIFARGLGVLAGRNQEARRGKLIGRGVAEFQMLVGTSDSVHGSGAGIGQELRGSPGRADLENGGVAPPKYTAT